MTAREDIEKLASAIAQASLQPEVTLETRIDALKVLNPYFSILMKNKGKLDEEPANGPSFGDFQRIVAAVEESPNGRTPLHGRHRRGATRTDS